MGTADGSGDPRAATALVRVVAPSRPYAAFGTAVGCCSGSVTSSHGGRAGSASAVLIGLGSATETQNGAARARGGGGTAPTPARSAPPCCPGGAGVYGRAPISGRCEGGATTRRCVPRSVFRFRAAYARGVIIPAVIISRRGGCTY